MSVKIGHARGTENGDNGKNGKAVAGDQTGKEVSISNWYNKPWTAVFRPKDPADAEKIAIACEKGCANDMIGYDQSQRKTLYDEAIKVGFDLSKITTPCETDCSAFVAVCVNAAGIRVAKGMYTGNELSVLKATGKFYIYETSEYCRSESRLKRGDILLGTGHTAMVLSNGKDADRKEEDIPAPGRQDEVIGIATAKGSVHIRNKATSLSTSLGIVKKGTKLKVLEVLSNGWYRIEWGGEDAFTSNVGGKYYDYVANGSEPDKEPEKDVVKFKLIGKYNLRKTPGSVNKPSGDKITSVPKGTIVEGDGSFEKVGTKKWYLVMYQSHEGYISEVGLKQI